jgi:hypothetical protein
MAAAHDIKVIPATQPAPAQASFTTTIQIELDGRRLSTQIHTKSINDLKRTLRALASANMLVEDAPAASTPNSDQPPICNLHNRPMKPSKKPGAWFCPAKLADGTYCQEKHE